jgi:TonB-linked SusC/RagA family outer membrane protein
MRINKKTIVMTLVAFCFYLTLPASNINFNLMDVTVRSAIEALQKEYGYSIVFLSDDVDTDRIVSVNLEQGSIDEVVKQILHGQDDLAYEINNRNITVRKVERVAAPTAQQQAQVTATGIVTDVFGDPLPGAAIIERGNSTNGTVTDIDGRFTLRVNQGATLTITYLGFVTQEVLAGANLAISLQEESSALDELVVIGYGVQRRVNLTGAVSTVSSERLASRATTSLSSALSGLAPGVSVRQGSGRPGSDGATIRIRGIGTFNDSYNGPLVIVDGSEASINSVNSEDVESISFLKDAASAAIYGSRGANGVILITTKRGARGEKPRVTYTGIASAMKMSGNAFRFEDNYAEYMEMANRWFTNPRWNASVKYPVESIEEWREALKRDRNAIDPASGVPNFLAYPMTQWVDHLFLPSSSQQHNMSVLGGSEGTNYLMSLNYLDNPGTLQNTGVKNYSGRINLESQITKFLKIGTQTFATFQSREPGSTSFGNIFSNTPNITPYYDGMYGIAVDGASRNNPLADVMTTGGSTEQMRLNTTWFGNLNVVDNLFLEVRYNYQTTIDETATWSKTVDRKNFRTGEITPGVTSSNASTTRATTRSFSNTVTGTLNYFKTIDDHYFAGLLGAERYYYNVKGFSARRIGLLDMSLPDFTAALDLMTPELGGTPEQDYGVVSYFGRLNYAYKGRYLFEANLRRDASSRFGPEYRWGSFPSFSAAWRINEESFMESTADYLSNLKLRASWGKLGNTTSGYYEWQATYGSVNYSFNGNVFDGLRQSKIANERLRWESVESANIGIELGFFNNRLTFETDVYSRTTKGILASPSVYLTMGTIAAPTTNTSDMRNRGMEFTMGWTDRKGDFSYGVNANFSFNHNVITKYKGKFEAGWTTDANGNPIYVTNRGEVADVSGNTIRVEGKMFNEFYLWQRHQGNGNIYLADGVTPDPNGGPRDGMIRTKADLDWVRAMLEVRDANGNRVYNFNNQSVGQNQGLWYGEMIYADINGDGMYGTNDNDRFFTGKSSIPKYNYGINLFAGWKGFDMSMTWAGSAGMYFHIYDRGFNNMSSSSWQEGFIIARNARNIYYYSDPEKAATDPAYDPASDPNANINAPYMRISNTSAAYRATNSELYNASYIKLKAMQVGYTLPKAWVAKAHVSNLRIFVSGENLLTITNFPGVDPEMGGSGFQSYPIPRIISGGINLTF